MFETSTRRWTVRELMRMAIDHLRQKGMDEARLTTELLLSHALKCARIALYTSFDKPVSAEELGVFRGLILRRLHGEPVQYITGESHFMGLALAADPRALIPRPETETLVEQVILWAHESFRGAASTLLDIGTGSGNIAVACAKLLPGMIVHGIDNSEPALEVARANAVRHGVADRVLLSVWDVRTAPPEGLKHGFDVIVSNPPYIPLADWERLETHVRDHEPQRALTDGADGLSLHRRIIAVAPSLLRGEGPLYLEVGEGQAPDVSRTLLEAGASNVHVVNDLQAIARVVSGVLRPQNGART